ncbi:MAG: NAD(P)H-hydrate dehydratase, partial [Symploca sp. SIO2B6]|nr:NAD(P)H-hydrate dehydratase [Symploca sp. SIO2B6]
TPHQVRQSLPLPRALTTHKYKEGHVLLICGSQRYMGAAILTGLAARASGVGLLSIAVPAALKTAIAARIPDAITIACPETESGAIAHLPKDLSNALQFGKYEAIACGPGLTVEAMAAIEAVLASPGPLLLDADGLNGLAKIGLDAIAARSPLTVLTPHFGEFKRLFFPPPNFSVSNRQDPVFPNENGDRISLVQTSAANSGAMVVLKGARVAIAHPDGRTWLNPNSTPALARGGSGDVLTGLMGGLMAQAIARSIPVESMIPVAVWWHAQAGCLATQQRTELGVDAETLTQYLAQVIQTLSPHQRG